MMCGLGTKVTKNEIIPQPTKKSKQNKNKEKEYSEDSWSWQIRHENFVSGDF